MPRLPGVDTELPCIDTRIGDNPETHYLVFDGSVQGGAGAFLGGTSDGALVVKVREYLTTGAGWCRGVVTAQSDGGTDVQNWRRYSTTSNQDSIGRQTSGATSREYVVTVADPTELGAIAYWHEAAGTTASKTANDGSIVDEQGITLGPYTLSAPTWIYLGQSPTGTSRGPAEIVSVCVLDANFTAAEVAAYAVRGVTAAEAFPDKVVESWNMSQAANNGSDFGVDGEVNGAASRITLSNMDADDLVAF